MRKLILNIVTPFSFLLFSIWLFVFIYFDLWHLFYENYFMTITMIFGSFISGATSEGGGAVAFPVMTLLFNIVPSTARDFSFSIQSFGMTAATFLIFRKKIPVTILGIVFPALGAILGNVIGFKYLFSLFHPADLKMFFCSLWMSFIFVFIKSLREPENQKDVDVEFNIKNIVILSLAGVLGGIVTALTGTGLDILTFSVLTLYFNVSIKKATPSSVVLMAINSYCALGMRNFSFGGLDQQAFEYLLICIPVVIFGAPLGSYLIKDRDKKPITLFLVTTVSIQFVAALFILPLSQKLIFLGGTTLLLGFVFFSLLSYFKSRTQPLLKS